MRRCMASSAAVAHLLCKQIQAFAVTAVTEFRLNHDLLCFDLICFSFFLSVMLNEAKTSRPRPKIIMKKVPNND